MSARWQGTGECAIAGRTSGLIEAGETVTWRARHFGRWWTMTSQVTVVERPTTFADEQASGPFQHFRHVHTFHAVPGSTFMVDEWEHTAPFGPIGWLADTLVLGRYMRRLLERRNVALKAEAERPVQVNGIGTNSAIAPPTAMKSGEP